MNTIVHFQVWQKLNYFSKVQIFLNYLQFPLKVFLNIFLIVKLHRIPKVPILNFSPLPLFFLQAFNASMSSYSFLQYIHQMKLMTRKQWAWFLPMIFSSNQHPCTCCFPFQLLLLHHHYHKVLQQSQGHKLCFIGTWEHEGLALEGFSYMTIFGDMMPA